MLTRLSLLTPTARKLDYPLFIFLPGMDGTGLLYQRQAQLLSPWFDVRCLSIPPNDLSDWDSLTEQLIGLIESELQLKQKYWLKNRSPLIQQAVGTHHSYPNLPEHPVYLCGESFGGCLALHLTVKAPNLIRRLILVNPASCFSQRPLLSWGIPLIQWIPELIHYSSTLAFLPFLAALPRISRSDRRLLLEAMRSVPCHIISWRLSLLRDFSIKEQYLARLTQRTLLIAGGSDRLLPSVEEAKQLSKILPDGQIVIFPSSGHACLLETEVKLDQILQSQDFLE